MDYRTHIFPRETEAWLLFGCDDAATAIRGYASPSLREYCYGSEGHGLSCKPRANPLLSCERPHESIRHHQIERN